MEKDEGGSLREDLGAKWTSQAIGRILPCADFPHGAAKIELKDTKGLHLTGQAKSGTETAFAIGTGLASCPYLALMEMVAAYGLDAPQRSEEPIFAAMLPDASRIFSLPSSWQGARALRPKDFNSEIKLLCRQGGMPSFTARCTRYGAASDMAAANVNPLIIAAAGRWRSIMAVMPYNRMTVTSAAHLARAFRV